MVIAVSERVSGENDIEIKFSNDEETVGFVNVGISDIEESKTARIDLELLEEAIEFAKEVGIDTKDIHIINTGGEANHLFITDRDKEDSGILVCGKTQMPKEAFVKQKGGE